MSSDLTNATTELETMTATEAGGRSSNLTKTTTEPEEGLAN
jgi:hypothetical protein